MKLYTNLQDGLPGTNQDLEAKQQAKLFGKIRRQMFGFYSNEASFASFYLILITVPLFPIPSFANKKKKKPQRLILSFPCLVLCCVKIKAIHAFKTPSVRQVGYSGSLNALQFMASENLWGDIFLLSHIAQKLVKQEPWEDQNFAIIIAKVQKIKNPRREQGSKVQTCMLAFPGKLVSRVLTFAPFIVTELHDHGRKSLLLRTFYHCG